jgi:hypothetical protein
MFDRPNTGSGSRAVTDGRDGLVTEGEGDPHVVDRVLQDSGDAVVVFRRDDEIGVRLVDLLVGLDDRLGVGR